MHSWNLPLRDAARDRRSVEDDVTDPLPRFWLVLTPDDRHALLELAAAQEQLAVQVEIRRQALEHVGRGVDLVSVPAPERSLVSEAPHPVELLAQHPPFDVRFRRVVHVRERNVRDEVALQLACARSLLDSGGRGGGSGADASEFRGLAAKLLDVLACA